MDGLEVSEGSLAVTRVVGMVVTGNGVNTNTDQQREESLPLIPLVTWLPLVFGIAIFALPYFLQVFRRCHGSSWGSKANLVFTFQICNLVLERLSSFRR